MDPSSPPPGAVVGRPPLPPPVVELGGGCARGAAGIGSERRAGDVRRGPLAPGEQRRWRRGSGRADRGRSLRRRPREPERGEGERRGDVGPHPRAAAGRGGGDRGRRRRARAERRRRHGGRRGGSPPAEYDVAPKRDHAANAPGEDGGCTRKVDSDVTPPVTRVEEGKISSARAPQRRSNSTS